MSNYKKSLLEQFKSSQGIKSKNAETKIYMQDFAEWILERKNIGEDYTYFLSHLELPFETSNCAEIGKSAFDSVVMPYDTTIITPHIEGLENLDASRVMGATFEVIEGTPVIYIPTKEDAVEMIEVPESEIKRYMTQNPYSMENIAAWHELHNSHEFDITIGLYGSIYDKDIEEKINSLKSLKGKLERDFIESYEEDNGKYYYVLASERKVKKLAKVLTRW